MRKLFYGAVILSLITLVGCSEDAKDSENPGEESEQSSGSQVVKEVSGQANEEKNELSKENEEIQNQIFEVGDSVKANDVIFTLSKATFMEQQSTSPAQNGSVLAVEMTIENTKKSNLNVLFAGNEFNLLDPSFTNYSTYYFGGLPGMQMVNLAPGEKESSMLYYDAPTGTPLELYFTPVHMKDFSFPTITWSVLVGMSE